MIKEGLKSLQVSELDTWKASRAWEGKKELHVFSKADLTKGHGVLSAYEEQVKVVRKYMSHELNITINPLALSDINHFHTINPTYYLRNKFFKKGVSVGYVHFLPETMDESIRLPKFARKVFYNYILKFYQSMDYLVVVNPYFIGKMEECGIDTKNTRYIPNLVSNDGFYKFSEEKRRECRAEYGLKDDDFLVLGVGQLQTRKGVFEFVDIAKDMPDITFYWAGGFSHGAIQDGYEEIKELLKTPPQNTKFLGIVEREKMNILYNICDLMFLPSYSELFPMTILEAMACNTPILLRDIELYLGILDGYYLKASDNDGFKEQILKIKNDSAYSQMAREMAKKGNDFYSEESIGRMWKDFYEEIGK